MANRLTDVLQACEAHRTLPDLEPADVTLISLQDLNVGYEERIQDFLNFARDVLGVSLRVVGGGFGCARINMRVDADKENERAWKLWRLLQSERLRQRARKIDFRVLITHDPHARKDLATGETSGLEKDRGVPLFCSYSHQDKELQTELRKHLAALQWMGVVKYWYDGEIPPGAAFDAEIYTRLRDAEIILFLVSSYFFDSEYIREKEIPVALARQQRGEANVIPIILRPVDWRFTPLGKLKALPEDSKPVTQWSDQHAAFANIAEHVREIAAARIRKHEPSAFVPRER
jgi:TIR domain